MPVGYTPPNKFDMECLILSGISRAVYKPQPSSNTCRVFPKQKQFFCVMGQRAHAWIEPWDTLKFIPGPTLFRQSVPKRETRTYQTATTVRRVVSDRIRLYIQLSDQKACSQATLLLSSIVPHQGRGCK